MGQKHWIESVYDELGPGLYRHALVILADSALAEDAVQQTFARLLERGRFVDIASAKGFLHAVLRHESYRLLKQARHPDSPPAGDDLLAATDETTEAREERKQLETALRQLPAEQREVIYLKLWEQLTFARIGEVLQVPLNTAASRYRYAIENLRQFMPRQEV